MIKIQKLIHDYIKRDDEGNVAGTVRAISGVDLDVQPGQFIAVLGHNGSGKSTLAKHLNALLFPTEGTVWVDGMDTKDSAHLWEIRREAGMVFQNPDNQIIAQVVEEDVGFGPENIGVPTEEIWKRVEESLAAVGMLEHRKKSPNRLSGGQKQRVSIAGVIAMEPKCIILDEPTAMLDPNGRKEVIKAAMKLNREKGITVILITHYMEEAIDADRIFVMDQGEVAMQGTPREIFSQVERMKELQLDVPQVTLLAHELRKAGLDLPASILTKEELVDALLGCETGQSTAVAEKQKSTAATEEQKNSAATGEQKSTAANRQVQAGEEASHGNQG
jgi:energy-coupling factor transport system ATP-binding protein